MIVTRPKSKNEPNLLLGHEFTELTIKDGDGVNVKTFEAPREGWTHDVLESLDIHEVSPYCWDAYLGEQWIGSSEV
jgi:hypothetical protein